MYLLDAFSYGLGLFLKCSFGIVLQAISLALAVVVGR